MRIDELQKWQRHQEESLARRTALVDRHRRRLHRLMALPALIGLVVLAVWVVQPLPYTEWPVGLLGLVLVVPWWATR